MTSVSAPTKPAMRPHCYVCAATTDLTEDHLPPEGFFPPGTPNLITAPLCSSCHKPFDKIDEAMRLWLSAMIGGSPAGKWIWKNKVLGSTFVRSPKLRAYIQEHHFTPLHFDTDHGVVTGGLLTVPQECAMPFIRRLTKGLLYNLHPEYDYFPDSFALDHQLPTTESVETVMEVATLLSQNIVGDGSVFRVWHGLTSDGDAGAWIYLFYETVCFVCFHGKDKAAFHQQFPEGFGAHYNLPAQL